MTRTLRNGLALLSLLTFAGCSTVPAIEAPTHTVQVTVTKYVPLPASLTEACATPLPASAIATNGDLLNAFLSDRANLAVCAAQVDAIRKLQSKVK